MNLIFDLVVPREYSEKKGDELMIRVIERMQEIDKRYQCVITLENSFVAE